MTTRKISVPNLILVCLEKVVQGGEFVLETSQDLREWIYDVYGDYPKTRDKYVISRAIRRLREKGLVEQEQKREGEIILRLTEKGREIAALINDNDGKWDGKWRMVIFDIPESKRLIRDVLRNRLRNWGFVRWQKSVWASKKNVTKQLRNLIKELEIEDWVLVVESDNVGFEKP